MNKRTFPESELIINADGSCFHLHLKPEQLADKVILVFTPSPDNKELTVTPSYWTGKDIPTNDDNGTILGRFSERLWIQYKNDLSSFVSYV